MTKLEEKVLDAARIRALQGIYAEAHDALRNWGLWSMDRRGTRPVGVSRPMYWDDITDEDREGWGDGEVAPTKPETSRRAPYNEKTALILDERIHAPGGLPPEIRIVLRVAYVSRETPEYQFARSAGCSTVDQFLERLEAALRFAKRFA